MNSLVGQISAKLRSPIALGSIAAASILTSVAGPFGTFDVAEFWERAAYWPVIVVGSSLMAISIGVVLEIKLPNLQAHQRALILAVLMMIGFVPFVYTFTRLFFGVDATIFPWLQTIIAVFVLTFFLDYAHSSFMAKVKIQALSPPANQFGLDPNDTVKHVTVDDHYVIVYSVGGSKRLLMRFSDALRVLDELEGIQVHRSHWVSKIAVTGSYKKSGQVVLILECGREVPVSRKFESAVQEYFQAT